jgi:predicted metalloprotease
MPRRLAGCVAGLALLAAAGCASSGLSRTTGPTPPVAATPVTAPPDCGSGTARDVESALRILSDGPDCPGSTNRFWREQIGATWTPPTFISYDDGTRPDSRCAKDEDVDAFADNAFYCPLDDKVAFSNQLMDRLYQQGGPYLPVVVLQHELGHRANHLANVEGVVSRSEENQADCEAGATTRFAYVAHRLPGADALRSAGLLFQLGDVSNFGSETADDPGAHGTPPQRVAAFGRGYFQGIRICDDLGRNPLGHTL